VAERGRRGIAVAALASAVAALTLAAPAAATTVVNGDFEAGGLTGWQVHKAVEGGDWFAYSGTETPISAKRGNHSVQPPPQGKRAAISDQLSAETLILYQDVALEPNRPHHLNLFAYYDSARPIAVPSPDTLSVDDGVLGDQRNQQFRVEVISPEAPLDTADPADILSTAFRTQAGAPRRMAPRGLSVDLSSLAGQTVRIRAVAVAHEELLNAGIDAVSITRTPDPPSGAGADGGRRQGGGADGARDRLRLGRARVDRRSGTVALAVEVPGPGLLSVRSQPRWAIQRLARKAKGPGTVWMRLRPRGRAVGVLARAHSLRTVPSVVFIPTAGEIETTSRPVVFRLASRQNSS
jgi:hypothetical protein